MRATASRLNTAAPMLWAALAFAGGIALSRYAWRPPLWWMLALALALSGAGIFAARSRSGALGPALLALLSLGALAGQVRTAPAVPPQVAAFDGARVLVTGHVIREGAPALAGLRVMRDSFDVESESLQPLDRNRQPVGPVVT